MMNKKRLAVLAMSAVMAASTVSVPVGAADFSDGAEVQVTSEPVEVTEEVESGVRAATYVTDPSSANWDLETGKVTFTMNPSDGQGEPVQREEQGTKTNVTEATCEKPASYQWKYTTDDGVPLVSGTVEEGTALGHNWQSKTEVISAGSCVDGTQKVTRTGEFCDRCNTWKPGYTDVSSDADHSLVGEIVTGYDVSEEATQDGKVYNTMLKDGKPVLVDTTKDGSYIEYKTQKCELCDKDIRYDDVVKTLNATTANQGISVVVADSVKNIKDEIGGKDITTIPKAEELQLKDCTKDASYQVAVYAAGVTIDQIGDAEPLRVYTVTVEAHHVTTNPTVEYANKEDEGLLSWTIKDGKLVVVNSSCVKDVAYDEVVKCASCGKEVSRTSKVAAKSTNHIYDTGLYNRIKDGKDEAVDVTELGDNGRTVKVIPETATCEAAGTVTVEFYCEACGEKAATITGVKVNPLGHTKAYKTENEVDATCEKEGTYDLITYCDRCGKELKKITVKGAKLPHTNGADGKNFEDAEWFIDFTGTAVGGKYEVGQTIKGDTIGDTTGSEILKAIVSTNCAMCHNHPVAYTDGSKDITLTVVSLQDATYANVYNSETGKYEKVTTKYGTITVGASYTTSAGETVTSEISLPYRSDINAKLNEDLKNGLQKDADGVVRYYINGQFAKDYAGIAVYGDGEFFVANGLICTDANGLNLYDGTWYMLSGGQIQRGYNNLALYDGEWFYVTNGELNEEVNGIVNYDGGQFLVINGRLGREVNGLWQNIDGDWYYLANGQVQTQYTGVAQYDGAFFYVVNGILDSDYNGTVEYDGETFKVVNGMLQ